MSEEGPFAELNRIERVADQSCSAHSRLRDRYSAITTTLDLLVLGASTWTLSLAFVDPLLAPRLAPLGTPPAIWIGLLSVVTFAATLVQLKLDLKGRSDAHGRASVAQAELKKAARQASQDGGGAERVAALQVRLALAAESAVSIPEHEFVMQKQRHLRKVAMSRHLDDHPFASIALLRVRWWLRDNGFGAGATRSGPRTALPEEPFPDEGAGPTRDVIPS